MKDFIIKEILREKILEEPSYRKKLKHKKLILKINFHT